MHTTLPPLPTIPLGVYRHYRGNEYEIVAVGRWEATEEPVVVYRALYDTPDVGSAAVWVRPVTSFLETITHEGVVIQRFTKVR